MRWRELSGGRYEIERVEWGRYEMERVEWGKV